MKIRVLQENLLKAVQDALKFISTKPPIPILSCILLEAKDGGLHIKATDLSVSIHTSIGCKVENPGAIAITGRVLADLLSTLSAGTLDLEVENGKLRIHSAKVNTSLVGVEAKEFPPFPEKKGKEIKLSIKQLSSLLEYGGLASGIDETRPVFSSIRLECSAGNLAMVATDGYRLSKKEEKVSCEMEHGVMVSARMLREVVRILQKGAGDALTMMLSEEMGQVFFGAEDCEIALRMVEGDYPSYQSIVPQECSIGIEVGAHELLAAVKTAMVFGREVSGIVTLNISSEGIEVSSAAASGESTIHVDVKLEKGEAGNISFNGKYLVDFLSVVGDGVTHFEMNDPLKPGIFTIPTVKNFFYVVMPFRVQS